MPAITNTTDASKASCGFNLTGSLSVFVMDGGLSRVVTDETTDGGEILGPGNSSVLCEDSVISLIGDNIASHPCCGEPGCPEVHCAATTGGNSTVFSG